jgi:hypothetical protein
MAYAVAERSTSNAHESELMFARLLALALLLAPLPASAQPYDYFCLFASQSAAQSDATVGAYYANAATWDLSTTFPGVAVTTPSALIDGISALTGWWIVISTVADNAALDAKANCVMKLDRGAAILGKSFVAAATLTGSGRTNLTFSPQPQGANYPEPLGQ